MLKAFKEIQGRVLHTSKVCYLITRLCLCVVILYKHQSLPVIKKNKL